MRKVTLAAMLMVAVPATPSHAGALQIAVNPSTEVSIGRGSAATCLDRQAYAKPNGQLSLSAPGPALVFDDFSLKLSAGDTFYIQIVQLVLKGRGVIGGSDLELLSTDEIDALLGTEKGTIHGPITIHSSDTTRKPPLAPCGLVFGRIPLVSGLDTASFNAVAVVSVSGSLQTPNGKVSYVSRNIRTKARFLGPN